MFNDKKQKNSHIAQKCIYKICHNYKKIKNSCIKIDVVL